MEETDQELEDLLHSLNLPGALGAPDYLRKGETFAVLAAGFGGGTTTAWRYVNETGELPGFSRRMLVRSRARIG